MTLILHLFCPRKVCHVREEPRIREQEWGNFKDADTVTQIREERLKVGPFYYRFLTGER